TTNVQASDNNIGAANVVPIPQSFFSTNIHEGRDPFFPDSTRRAPKPAQLANKTFAQPILNFSSYLKLTGLWPSKRRPLALINKTPIGPGEEAGVTVVVTNGQNRPETHRLVVRCLEIRNQSVVISVEGESGTKELLMQPRL